MGETIDLATAQSDSPAALVEGVMEGFDSDVGRSLERIEQAGRDLQRFAQHEHYEAARGFLNAAGNFFRALAVVQTTADFAEAATLLEQASNTFSELGIQQMADASEGLRQYFAGIVDLQRTNLTSGIELLKSAQERLGRAGDLGSLFRPLLDHIAPEQLFAAGAVAVARQDYALGKALIEDAAKRSEHLAATYAEVGTPSHFFYLGLAKLHRSYFGTFNAWAHFTRFDLDPVVQAEDACLTARQARELLAQAELDHPVRENCYRLAGVLSGVMDVLPEAARLARALLAGQPCPEMDYPALRKRLQAAEDDAAAGGEQMVVLVRMCGQLASTLDNLRRFGEVRPKAAPRQAPPGESKTPVRVFVMMPFSEECKTVEEALRQVLENEPYWFQVILARDRTIQKNLFENVKAHMNLVDGFFADISDLNPNVMLELGMTENDPRERPVFVLRREGSKKAPSDLKARLYIEYRLPGATAKDRIQTLAEQLARKLESIEDLEVLRRRRTARYLSPQHITQRLQRARLAMNDEEAQQLQKAFPTVEELESADARLIAGRTGFDAKLAASIARAFKPAARRAVRD